MSAWSAAAPPQMCIRDRCTIKECETVEGEISKNNAAWRIVLAGLADGASWANQRTAYGWSEKHEAVDANGRPTTETVTGTFDYDFAIGQNQNCLLYTSRPGRHVEAHLQPRRGRQPCARPVLSLHHLLRHRP